MLINRRRAENSRTGDKPRNQPRGRRLGNPKEKPLPFPGKTKPISLDAVSLFWLQSHPECATSRLILGYTKQEKDEDEPLRPEESGGEDDDEAYLDPVLRGDPLYYDDNTEGREGYESGS